MTTKQQSGISSISIEDIERAKTDERKAEDIAYTINHTITCLGLDIFVPIISAYYTRWRHGAIDAHQEHFFEHLKEWFTGEIAGDLGAVPVTIAAQRMAPGFMQVLNRGMEALLGPAYRWGAQKAARHWASEQGIAQDSKAFKAHAQQLYDNEVSHLSQAAVWTVAAFVLNVMTQKAIGSSYSTRQIIEGKLIGALTATTVVLGARAIDPEKAHRWDQYTSQNIFLPLTKKIGGVLGVDHEAVERMANKEGVLPLPTASRAQHHGAVEALSPKQKD